MIMHLVSMNMNTMLFYPMEKCEKCTMVAMKMSSNSKRRYFIEQRWDWPMKYENHMNTNVMKKHIGESIMILKQRLRNCSCCERILIAGQKALQP